MSDFWKPKLLWMPRFWCGGPCKHFGFDVKWRRKNTAYVDDKSNWMCSCSECYQETYDYYEERWSDYYSSRL